MNVLKQLSTCYLNDAKSLGYTWMDLIKKETRQEVINKVINHKMTKAINKARKTQIDDIIRDAGIQQKEEEVKRDHLRQKEEAVKREHERIMKKQPKTSIEQVAKAMKGYTKSFEIGIINNKDPLAQLQNTRKAIEYHIISILTSMKGLKFVETLRVTFTKMSNGGIVYKTAYFNSKAQTIINNIEIPEPLQLTKQKILNMIAQWVSEGSGWTVESVDNHYLNIVQYQTMKGSSYIKLPQELRNSRKGLINMQNKDNECFRWCHIRHLNPQDKNPQKIKKSDKQYIQNLDYTGIEFPVTTKNISSTIKSKSKMRSTSMYSDMKINNHIPSLCQKKNMTNR